jgi:hypothetical protein
MYFASAYPNPALSAGAMIAIAFVVLATLACWLIMVFVAARPPRAQHSRQAHGDATPAGPVQLAAPDAAAEDEHSEVGSYHAAREHHEAA